MKFGIPISFLLHAAFFSGGIVLFKTPPPLPQERLVIPIDIITVAQETNIRAAVKRPEPKPEPEPEPETPTAIEPAPEPEASIVAPAEEVAEPEPAPAPAPPEPEPVTIDTEQVAEAPEADTPQESEPETPAFSLDNLSALIDRSRDDQPAANTQKVLESEKTLYAFADQAQRGAGAGDDQTLSAEVAVAAAMRKCWRMPAGAKNPESLTVFVSVKLHRDGYVASAKFENPADVYNSPNPHMSAVADNALRAVSKCAPYDFLNQDRYDHWKQMTLKFDPTLLSR